MMNKISLGFSISSFVLILIIFVFGNINLNFNEEKSVVVEQPTHDFCNPSHKYYDKYWADTYNKHPDDAKVFSCAEAYYIDIQIENNMDKHNDYGKEKKHHSHSYDINGNMQKDSWY